MSQTAAQDTIDLKAIFTKIFDGFSLLIRQTRINNFSITLKLALVCPLVGIFICLGDDPVPLR